MVAENQLTAEKIKMKVLGFTLAGAFLGCLIGAIIGEWQSVEQAGFLAIFYVDAFMSYYGRWGHLSAVV